MNKQINVLSRQMTVCPNQTKWITSNVYRIQNQQTMKKRENVINIENVCTLLVYYRCQMGRDKLINKSLTKFQKFSTIGFELIIIVEFYRAYISYEKKG